MSFIAKILTPTVLDYEMMIVRVYSAVASCEWKHASQQNPLRRKHWRLLAGFKSEWHLSRMRELSPSLVMSLPVLFWVCIPCGLPLFLLPVSRLLWFSSAVSRSPCVSTFFVYAAVVSLVSPQWVSILLFLYFIVFDVPFFGLMIKFFWLLQTVK